MTDFRKKFEEAVHSVAAEIEAMDDVAFERMLAEHCDGDIAQILREIDFGLELSALDMFHASFVPAHGLPVTQSLILAQEVEVLFDQRYVETLDECPTVA